VDIECSVTNANMGTCLIDQQPSPSTTWGNSGDTESKSCCYCCSGNS